MAGSASARVTVNVGGGGLQPPPQAAAQGLTSLVFNEDFNSLAGIDTANTRQPGFNFYRHMAFGGPLTTNYSVSNSILTFTGPGGSSNASFITTTGIANNQWIGHSFLDGAYFECSLAFNPTTGPTGWPAFWSMADEHLWGGNNNGWIECDFFDKYFAGATEYLSGGHWWTGPNQIVSQPAVQSPDVTGFDWNQFHTLGMLWVPGNRWQHYRDNVSVVSFPYTTYPFLVKGDNQSWNVIIGSDNHQMKVDWIRVWQAPT
jgi:hypothetical protein